MNYMHRNPQFGAYEGDTRIQNEWMVSVSDKTYIHSITMHVIYDNLT